MTRRVLIDTSAYTALLSGRTAVADILAETEVVLLSAIVVGELLDGFLGGSRERENRRALARFRSKPRTVLVPVTDETAEWFAVVKQKLCKKGKPGRGTSSALPTGPVPAVFAAGAQQPVDTMGSIRCDYPVTITDQSRGLLGGTAGAGGPLLSAHTTAAPSASPAVDGVGGATTPPPTA